MTHLWQADPFKAKWSILAKAYSLIRDTLGKEQAPLDRFLAVNSSFIGIVTPENYLAILGWDITVREDGQLQLHRVPGFQVSNLDNNLFTTNFSVDDIIQHCHDCQYITLDGSGLGKLRNEQAMTMASSSQFESVNSGAHVSTNGPTFPVNGASSGFHGQPYTGSAATYQATVAEPVGAESANILSFDEDAIAEAGRSFVRNLDQTFATSLQNFIGAQNRNIHNTSGFNGSLVHNGGISRNPRNPSEQQDG